MGPSWPSTVSRPKTRLRDELPDPQMLECAGPQVTDDNQESDARQTIELITNRAKMSVALTKTMHGRFSIENFYLSYSI